METRTLTNQRVRHPLEDARKDGDAGLGRTAAQGPELRAEHPTDYSGGVLPAQVQILRCQIRYCLVARAIEDSGFAGRIGRDLHPELARPPGWPGKMLFHEENPGLRAYLDAILVFFEEYEHLISPPVGCRDYTQDHGKSLAAKIGTLWISRGP